MEISRKGFLGWKFPEISMEISKVKISTLEISIPYRQGHELPSTVIIERETSTQDKIYLNILTLHHQGKTFVEHEKDHNNRK